MKYLLLLLVLPARPALSQTLDSTQVTAIPPEPDFRFSYITELGSMLAFTRPLNMQHFFRQNQINRAFPSTHSCTRMWGGRYRRFKLILETGYATNA